MISLYYWHCKQPSAVNPLNFLFQHCGRQISALYETAIFASHSKLDSTRWRQLQTHSAGEVLSRLENVADNNSVKQETLLLHWLQPKQLEFDFTKLVSSIPEARWLTCKSPKHIKPLMYKSNHLCSLLLRFLGRFLFSVIELCDYYLIRQRWDPFWTLRSYFE